MTTFRLSNTEPLNSSTQETRGTFRTDQHRNTGNTMSLGKCTGTNIQSNGISVWVVGNSTKRTTTPKVGKVAIAAFPTSLLLLRRNTTRS